MTKTILFAAVSLVIGAVVGLAATTLEFKSSGDNFVDMIQVDDLHEGDSRLAGGGKVTVVNGETFDFGVMDQFNTGSHTFQVKNAGQGELTVALLQTSCTCTTSDMAKGEPIVLEPGEVKDVTLQWTVKGFARSFNQSATLRTSDPERQAIRLVVEGRISSLLSLEPGSIVFSNLSNKREATDLLRVYSYKYDDLECVEIRQMSSALEKYFDIEVSPMDAEMVAEESDCKSGLLVKVTASPGLPLGPFRQEVRLVTNLEDDTSIHFDVEGNVVGDISVWTREKFSQSKQLLDLELIKRGQRRKAELQIIVKGEHMAGTQVAIDESATVPAGILKATLGAPVDMGKSARRFPLTIEIDAGNQSISRLARADEDNYGKVILKTTHPDAPELVIRVAFATGG